MAIICDDTPDSQNQNKNRKVEHESSKGFGGIIQIRLKISI